MAGKVQELTDANFQKAVSQGVALIDFWAPWCGPCRMQGPIIEKIAPSFTGKAVIAKVNVDESPDTASKFGVRSIPTLIIFKDGQMAEQFVGVQTEEAITSALEKHLGGEK